MTAIAIAPAIDTIEVSDWTELANRIEMADWDTSARGNRYQPALGRVVSKGENTIFNLIGNTSEHDTNTGYCYFSPTEVTASEPFGASGPLTGTELPRSRTTAEVILEIRRRSGLTWEQLGEIFNVSRRSVHHWANGKAPSAQHERHIWQTLAVIRHMDEGSQTAIRHRLLTIDNSGLSIYDLLVSRRFSEALQQAQAAGSTVAGEYPRTALSKHEDRMRRPTSPVILLDADHSRPDLPSSEARLARSVRTT